MDQTLDPLFQQLFQGDLHRNWASITGFVVLFLVHIAKKGGLSNHVPSKYVPLISVALGILLSIGDNFLSNAVSLSLPWYDVLFRGFITGAGATGLWEMVFKHFLDNPSTTPATATIPGAVPEPVTPSVPPVAIAVTPTVPVAIPPATPPQA